MLQTRWLTFGVAWLILLAGYYRLLAVPNRTPAQRVTVFTSLGYLMVVALAGLCPGRADPARFLQGPVVFLHGAV